MHYTIFSHYIITAVLYFEEYKLRKTRNKDFLHVSAPPVACDEDKHSATNFDNYRAL